MSFSAYGFHLEGWVLRPDESRPLADVQYFYLNGRVLRDRVVQHALRQVFQRVIPEGRQPGYVLFMTVEPGEVDVNVHPTKHEVRFHDSRSVHDFLQTALQRTLAIDPPVALHEASGAMYRRKTTAVSLGPSVSSQISEVPAAELPWRWVAALRERYWLLEEEQHLWMVDGWRLAEAWMTARLESSEQQALLAPEPLWVPESLHGAASGDVSLLESLGFTVETLSSEHLVVRAVPRCCLDFPTEERRALVHNLLSFREEGAGRAFFAKKTAIFFLRRGSVLPAQILAWADRVGQFRPAAQKILFPSEL